MRFENILAGERDSGFIKLSLSAMHNQSFWLFTGLPFSQAAHSEPVRVARALSEGELRYTRRS